MRLLQLKADNFRLFSELSLSLHDRLNFFFGPNAAGKTTLLETMFALGRGKSFRGSSSAELAGAGGRHWTVFARVEREAGVTGTQAIEWRESALRARVDGRPAQGVEFVRRMPVQVLEPGMHRVLQDGPTYRRGFMDWGVFHVEQSFIGVWQRYRRALQQRNSALRNGASSREIAVWEPELAETGEQLQAMRSRHVAALQAALPAQLSQLLDEGEWSLDLRAGWGESESLAEALALHRERDRRSGVTQFGPHRAELRIKAGQHGVKNRISRGQQKLLIAALLLSQCDVIRAHCGWSPVLLVDDFAAELADRYQQSLLAALAAYPGQVHVTAFGPSGVLAALPDCGMFHVERGRVRSAAEV
ncbi:MAG: DNA replication/repair protein RecF [Nevskiales bacterium]|nr:DNA replication/repair protein RecF [Nevskiales bacterium]